MKYFGIPYCSEETATMYFFEDDPMEANINQTNITREQLESIYESCDVKVGNHSFDVMAANVMNCGVIADGVDCEDFTYHFDSLAIIPIEHLETVTVLNEALWKQCGGDSSTYRACETFHETCRTLATKVIDIVSNATIEEM